MTVQEIKLLHAFNSWANNRFFDSLSQVPVESYMKDMKSSHGGIHGTLLHMVGAERRWLTRWNGTPVQDLPDAKTLGTLEDVKKYWESTGYELARFLGTMTDKKLQETFTITNPSGETFSLPYVQSIQHLMDHSTYHRGQIVTLLRQLGIKPPSTGMIGFFRETAKLKQG